MEIIILKRCFDTKENKTYNPEDVVTVSKERAEKFIDLKLAKPKVSAKEK